MIGIDLGWLLFAGLCTIGTLVVDDVPSKIIWTLMAMGFIYIAFTNEDNDDDDEGGFRRHSSMHSGV